MTRGICLHGHLRGPLSLTPVANPLAVELSLPVLRHKYVADGIRAPNPPHARRMPQMTVPPPL